MDQFPYATQTITMGLKEKGYDNVTVKEQRKAIVIESENVGRIARLKPLGSKNFFQLYFRDRNDKRWDATPFIGDANEMLSILTNELNFWLKY